jgi:hypothetical protein
MDALLQPPVATAFDAIASTASALLYLAVAFAAVARAPRDVRTRVFLASAVASAGPYMVTALLWARGTSAAFNTPVITVVTLSLMMGSLALLHFTQVFPWRRPWIRSYGAWLYAGYLVVPLIAAAVLWLTADMRGAWTGIADMGSGGVGGVSVGLSEVGLMVSALGAIPVLFVLGVAVPFGGLLSLYKSWKTATAAHIESARVTTFWMLISQLAGGVLTILIIPLLRVVAPAGPWVTIAATLLFAVGLLMPIAFAVGVWKLRVLDLDLEAPLL